MLRWPALEDLDGIGGRDRQPPEHLGRLQERRQAQLGDRPGMIQAMHPRRQLGGQPKSFGDACRVET
jgi:hypothetical protein